MKRHERKRSTVKDDIIQILLIEEERGVRYSDIKDILLVSDTTLSKNLKELLHEDKIILHKTSENKQHYFINKKGKNQPSDLKVKLFAHDYMTYIRESIDKLEDSKNYDKNLFELIIKKISPYFVFLMLKSFETGDNWYKVFNDDSMKSDILSICYLSLYQQKEQIDTMSEFNLLINKEYDTYFKQSNKKINKQGKVEFEILYKMLKDIYPKEMKKLFELSK